MDRTIVYTGQIPLDVNILEPQRNAMVGIGALAQATIGAAFGADGFAVTPSIPADLVLNVGPGSVYAQGVIDQTAYGSLPAIVGETTVLQGISLDTVPLTFVPPGGAGQAVNYLIQVGISVTDTVPVVLPYYNAANPIVPWLGPNNSGTAQNTVRRGRAVLSAKVGVAATAGTQATPAPDPGFYGLYVVTIANGQSALTSNDVTLYAGAPFIPTTLQKLPNNIQSGKWTFAIDTGTANEIVANLSPAPAALVQGLRFSVLKTGLANDGPAKINLNVTGSKWVKTIDGADLVKGELPANAILDFAYDGTNFQLLSVAPSPRKPIRANITLYVRNDGNDSNTGLANTSGGALKTLQAAWDRASALYELSGFRLTIQFGQSGTYAGAILWNRGLNGDIHIKGDTAAPSNYTIGLQTTTPSFVGAIYCFASDVTIEGVTINGTTTGNVTVIGAANNGVLSLSEIVISYTNVNTSAVLISAQYGGAINLNGNITISGGGTVSQVCGASDFGRILGGSVVPLNLTVQNLTWTIAFASAGDQGNQKWASSTCTITATGVTGPRYLVQLVSVINTIGGGANFFPGTVAGTQVTATSGHYA